MKSIKNLVYSVERYVLNRESGKIEEIKLEPRCYSAKNSFDNSLNNSGERFVSFFAESVEDIPTRVKFRNPLGELIEKVHCYGYVEEKGYKIGDNYS